MQYYILSNLFLASGDVRSVAINYNSNTAPEFYLNEQVTFTCSAIGFEKLVALRLFYHNKNVIYKAGCAWFFNTWESINELRNGIRSAGIDATYCASIDTPSMLN